MIWLKQPTEFTLPAEEYLQAVTATPDEAALWKSQKIHLSSWWSEFHFPAESAG